jgi:N-acetylgalactosamine-6-sulfatase
MKITRRQALAAALSLPAAMQAHQQQQQPPNIVLLFADDLGCGDLSCEGATDIRTPHIDSIGKQGVRFLNGYCNAPECTPSRTALLTGRYQQRVGGMECALGVGNVGRYDEAIWLRERNQMGLPTSEPTIARMLKDNGYDTAITGKWHLGYTPEMSPNAHGFDHAFYILGGNADYYTHKEEDGTNVLYENGKQITQEGYVTDLFGRQAVQWLSKRSSDKPFFLYVPFTSPHSPFQTPNHRDIPKGGYNRGTRALYAGMVEAMDAQVGAILAQLDKQKASANTWVIFLSDNGGTGPASNGIYRGKKSSVYEGGLRTPILMRWPGMFTPGSQTAQVTAMFDLTAAMLAAAKVRPPRRLDGENLLPIWQGKQEIKPRSLFWRYRRAENTRSAARQGDWKLVVENGKEELFHLGRDPKETTNLLASEETNANYLRRKLSEWDRETRAPRLEAFYAAQKK